MSSRDATPTADLIATLAAGLLLALALLLGGGPRGLGDTVVHLAMLPCLALGIARWRWGAATPWQRAFLLWWLAALALVALQLLPLPPALYARLPQRAGVLADLAAAGVAPGWHRFTLDTWATVRAGLALLTFGALWLLASTLPPRLRRHLLVLVLVLAGVTALLGFAQAAGGARALRFHAYHHPMGAIGTFANRNHFATLMAMLLPMALALGAAAQRARRLQWAIAWFGMALVLWLAAALSYSRTGFALATAALVAALALLWPPRGAGPRRWIVPVALVGLAAIAAGHYALDGLLQRLQQDPLDDLRWQYLRNGVVVLRQYLPWGSGLGTFPWVYAPAEPVWQMLEVYAERAHNDLLQVAIEAGVPGLLLVGAFLVLLAWPARTVPMGTGAAVHETVLRRVTAVALATPLLHSLVDYPLRTLSVATVTALVLSLHRPERA